MKTLIALFILWVLGSIATFATVGTAYIIPYALVTIALFVLAVVLANKKPPTTLNSFALPVLLAAQLPAINYQLLAAIGLLILAYVAKAVVRAARTSWLNKY